MRRFLLFLMIAPMVLLAGCAGDMVYYQTRYAPTSVEDSYSGAARMSWHEDDRSAYELPANPPAIDDLHRSRKDCVTPGQKFKASTVAMQEQTSPRSIGTMGNGPVARLEDGPQPVSGLLPMKGYPVGVYDDPNTAGARERIGVSPEVGGFENKPASQPASGLGTANPFPAPAYRTDEPRWCVNQSQP